MMFDPTTLTGIHTLLSLVAMGTGILAVLALLGPRVPKIWTHLFLATAVATSATGFVFPATGVLREHVIGAVALVVLAMVIVARFVTHLAGAWRWIYAVGVVASVYLLFFVAIAQAFRKVPALKAMAPTGSEPPLAIAQVVALVIFIGLGVAATRLFGHGGAAASRA
ncbi:MAG TPA: hypothetical protein VKQ29_09105 [Aliidongia sp.]|nr:hypothetical protein [Aliidongia sp.]